jgi:hypothetical protein
MISIHAITVDPNAALPDAATVIPDAAIPAAIPDATANELPGAQVNVNAAGAHVGVDLGKLTRLHYFLI